MARRRKGLAIHGWLNIDKPEGFTSNAVVGRVRRLLNAAKVGHGGTLDPLASGILPIALGEATKTVSYVMDGSKHYRFAIRFGQATETDDREGAVTEIHDHRPTKAEIRAALPAFVGVIDQVPPAYSAIKVDGARAYDLARSGEEVDLKSRQIRIDALDLIAAPAADEAIFEVRTGKGAYVRALARDLARALGTVGHVTSLRRLAVGPFVESDAISLEKLEESLAMTDDLGHSAAPSAPLLPIETALADIPALALTETEAQRLRMGQALPALPIVARSNRTPSLPAGVVQGATLRAMADGKIVALARIEGGEIRPVRVLNL